MLDDGYSNGWIRYGRARLNLSMRLASRAHSVLAVGGAAKGPLRTVVAAASAVADVALAGRLARSDRSELALHGAVNAVDLATWTALSTRPGPEQLSTAMGAGHPLAIEAGARHGLLGLAVPVAGAAVNAMVERRRGRPAATGAFVWQVAAALGGAGLSRYAHGLRARTLAAHESDLAPELSRAELAGQSDEALALDNLLDAAQRAAVLVELGAGEAPANRAGRWKADLAGRTRSTHHYLIDVLTSWEQRHNLSPDLSTIVHLVPDPELAPIVLRSAEATALDHELDRLGLRGHLDVGRAEGGTVDRLVLRVGEHHVSIVVGPSTPPFSFDPIPGAFAWSALWLAAAGPQADVPPWASFGPAAGALGLMAWAHRTPNPDVPVSRDRAVLCSTVLTVGAALLQTATMRRSHVDERTPSVPASLALRGHAFVTALADPALSPPVRAVAWAGGVGALAGSWALTPKPRPIRELLAELAWVAMAATMAQAFIEGIERDSAEVEATVRAEAEDRLAVARRHGHLEVVHVAQAALRDAEALYAVHADRLDPSISDEARRRLDDCGRRLAAL